MIDRSAAMPMIETEHLARVCAGLVAVA